MGLSLNTVKNNDRFVRLLIYGPPGVGKTTFAASAPNPVIMDFENSAETLRGTDLENTPLAGTRTELANYSNVLSFIKEKNEYDTIIVDSISSMNDTFLMEHMKKQKNRDEHIALFADFRKISNVLKEVFYELISVPKNVVLVAHQKELVSPETNKILQVRPLLPPAAEASVERLVNEVFYLEAKPLLKGGTDRVMHVSSQGMILAKNRSALTENKYTNIKWKDIYGN